MPIHDWTRVDANLFHHFHQMWTAGICNALNAGLLPPGYVALMEQRAAGLVPDVLALKHGKKSVQRAQPTGGRVITATPPQTRHVMRATRAMLASRANRIAIQHPLGDVISIIEIVSPGNKGSRTAIRSFTDKTIELLNRGVHVLVVDLFPPSVRDPQGIHKAIWDEIEDNPFELPPDKPLTLASYVADVPREAYVEPVGVSDTLPDMPAFLDVDHYVPVPLEATYASTWASCPEMLREAVEQGEAFNPEA